MWFSVKDVLPAYTGFVWVKRYSSDEVQLAYFYEQPAFPDHKFQDAESAGDKEGLSVEWFQDVTHWHELYEPEFRSVDLMNIETLKRLSEIKR